MRRADRLFQIVQILRNRRCTTANYLAERLQVSVRTVYRDIQDLSLSGVPVEGEAGVGYCLRHSMDIPPLMFNEDEIQAIVLGARMVESWGGKELAQAARSAIDKVEHVLPSTLKHLTNSSNLYALPYDLDTDLFDNLSILRRAINGKHPIDFSYTKLDGGTSTRTINPLALYFWGSVWTLVGWCYLRNEFRNFRIDRMHSIQASSEHYQDEPGKRLEDFLGMSEEECRKN